MSDDHISDPVTPVLIRPREPVPTFAAETREDTLNDVVYRLGILRNAIGNSPRSFDADGVALAQAYVRAMVDAER